jgi:uncharacterized protein YjbJ (UPF0337 family)
MNQYEQPTPSGPQGPTAAGGDEYRRTTTGSATDQARGAVSDVSGAARDAAGSVQHEAAGLASDAKRRMTEGAEAQKAHLAERIGSFADHVGRSASDLRQDEPWLADFIERGAREIGHFASDMRDRDFGSLAHSIEGFARRQPALFIGASVALGFALGRVATGSSRPGRRGYGYDTDYSPGMPGYAEGRPGYPEGPAGYGEDRSGYGGSAGLHESAPRTEFERHVEAVGEKDREDRLGGSGTAGSSAGSGTTPVGTGLPGSTQP